MKKGWSFEMIVGCYEKKVGKPFPLSVPSIYRFAAARLFKLQKKLLIPIGMKKNNLGETHGKKPQLKKIHGRYAPKLKLNIGKEIL